MFHNNTLEKERIYCHLGMRIKHSNTYILRNIKKILANDSIVCQSSILSIG